MADYFEFMGLPRGLTLDEGELQRRYFALSREYHPDFHTQAGDDARQESLEQSSLLNQAFKTLKDPFERARYLVNLEWPDLPDAEKKRIPPILLMEVMEMQEKVAEAQFEEDAAKREERRRELLDVDASLRRKMEGLRDDLDRIAGAWSALPPDAPPEPKRAILKQLNELLNTRNYIRTLLATIDAVLNGGPGVRH
jgi:molecular chaperone HscB